MLAEIKKPKLSVCIATYNMKEVLWQTVDFLIDNILFSNYEIIVYDDCSTDGTDKIEWFKDVPRLKYIRGNKNVGVGDAFNNAIKAAKGEYIMLMCADDLLIDYKYVEKSIKRMDCDKFIGYATRYYYQYVGWVDNKPVRAWRCDDPIHLANNPSGLIFRKKALKNCWCSNKMFIETSQLASQVIRKGWGFMIYPYDAIAVRVWDSTSTKPGYYLKRRVSSPVMDWNSIGVDMSKEYVSFLQIKNGFKTSAVIEEMINFIKLRPVNVISPSFWFYGLLAVITPRFILRQLPKLYRRISPLWERTKLR